MPITIGSFNVNSIKARLDNLFDWLRLESPDVLCLQEIKCVEDSFPFFELKALGYEAVVCGQKAYNGVAILSKEPARDVMRGLPGGDGDVQARYVEATIKDVRVCGLYLPNGNPSGTEKFAFKLAWMERLRARAQQLLEGDMPVVLAGDFNVIPEPEDCHDPQAWLGDALFQPETRRAFRSLLHLGLYDAFRALHPKAQRAWTFWDYQAGAFQADSGIRIDHILLSPQALDRLTECRIDKNPRGKLKASDHTPILAQLADA